MNLRTRKTSTDAEKLPTENVAHVLPKQHSVIQFDPKIPGLGRRIHPSGRSKWIVRKRPAGSSKLCTITIADGNLKRAAIVPIAMEILSQLARGIDPNIEKKSKREAERTERAERQHTFGRLGIDYLRFCEQRKQPVRPSTLNEYSRLLRSADLEPWKNRPVGTISHQEVKRLLDRVSERAPIMANRLGEFVGQIFKRAVRDGLIVASPMDRLDRREIRNVQRPRRRSLVHPITGDLSELLAVWRASESYESHHPTRALVQLLILTGQRAGVFVRSHPGQSEALRWSMVRDLDKPELARLEIPPELRKTGADGESHFVPLSPLAVQALDRLAIVANDAPVLTVDGQSPIRMSVQIRDALRQRTDAAAGHQLEPWHLHDLRRSMRTGLSHLGCPVGVAEELLDHSSGERSGIAGVYNVAQRLDLSRQWLDRWSDRIEESLQQSG